MDEDEEIEEERRAMARYLDRLRDAKIGTIFRLVLIIIGMILMAFFVDIEPHSLIIFCIAYEVACYIRVEEMLDSYLLADSRKVKMRRFFKIGNLLRAAFIILTTIVLVKMEADELAVGFLFLALMYYEIEYSRKVREQLALYRP